LGAFGAKGGVFYISSDLSPSEAQDAKIALLNSIKARKRSLKIELDGEPNDASISAVQLMISAARSSAPKPPKLAEKATATILNHALPKHLEHEAK